MRKFLEQTAVLAGASTNNLIKIVFGEERKERLNKKELSREEKRSSISSINSRRGFITATSFVFGFLVL